MNMRRRSVFNLPEAKKHIENLCRFCETIHYEATEIEKATFDIGGYWSDDVYRTACNTLTDIFKELCGCIRICVDEAGNLTYRYRETYEKYFEKTDYLLPKAVYKEVATSRLKELAMLKNDIQRAPKQDMFDYADRLERFSYIVLSEFSSMEKAQIAFGEYYQSNSYDEMTEELSRCFRMVSPIIAALKNLANKIRKRADVIT